MGTFTCSRVFLATRTYCVVLWPTNETNIFVLQCTITMRFMIVYTREIEIAHYLATTALDKLFDFLCCSIFRNRVKSSRLPVCFVYRSIPLKGDASSGRKRRTWIK